MKTIIATTLAGLLCMGTGAAFAQQTPPPTEPQTPPPMRPMTQRPTSPETSCASRFPTFSQLDVKNQGQITRQEARQVPALEKGFKRADTDHNGKLSQMEYSRWVEKQCAHAAGR